MSDKIIDLKTVNEKMEQCLKDRHLTNGGKNVVRLQDWIRRNFLINDDKEVLMVCNGAMGLNALIGGLCIHHNRKLKFAVQSFTFPCSVQGMLTDSLVMDLDDNLGPDITRLEAERDRYDGIVITNPFGCVTNISLYERFCSKHNKMLIFDNAASPMAEYEGGNILNRGIGCMVSLHHTKPVGFGEGGFIVFDKELLGPMSKAICFGFTSVDKYNFSPYAGNHKMSEVSCIYIAEYLKRLPEIHRHHTTTVSRFIDRLEGQDSLRHRVSLFRSYAPYGESLMSTIPVLFDFHADVSFFIERGIEAKKYYYPLDATHRYSKDLFDRIICLPLNMQVDDAAVDRYIRVLLEYVDAKAPVDVREGDSL